MARGTNDAKNTTSVRTGLKIHWAVKFIIAPLQKAQYPANQFELRQVVGIDTSDLYVARTGIRGSNDLVWVGRAANHAAKLTDLSPDYPTYITDAIYRNMNTSVQ